ncbi:MAG: hypothetical protein ACREYE_11560, partial [Gammaproteobacteria bacterium]
MSSGDEVSELEEQRSIAPAARAAAGAEGTNAKRRHEGRCEGTSSARTSDRHGGSEASGGRSLP